MSDSGAVPICRIELVESSGPVSPRHQYETRILIESSERGVYLDYEDEGEYRDGAPARSTKVSARPVGAGSFLTLWNRLIELGALALPGHTLDPEKKRRLGIAPNHLLLEHGDTHMRFEYTLAQLRGSSQLRERQLLDVIKESARNWTAS